RVRSELQGLAKVPDRLSFRSAVREARGEATQCPDQLRVIEPQRNMRFGMLRLELERLLEVVPDPAGVAGCDGLQDRNALAIAAEHEGERVVQIRLVGKSLQCPLAPLDRLAQDPQAFPLALFPVQRVNGRSL